MFETRQALRWSELGSPTTPGTYPSPVGVVSVSIPIMDKVQRAGGDPLVDLLPHPTAFHILLAIGLKDDQSSG